MIAPKDKYHRRSPKADTGKVPILLKFGENIRKLRETRGWTQEELGKKLGMSQIWISYVERGSKNISIAYLPGFAEVFGVPFMTLLG